LGIGAATVSAIARGDCPFRIVHWLETTPGKISNWVEELMHQEPELVRVLPPEPQLAAAEIAQRSPPFGRPLGSWARGVAFVRWAAERTSDSELATFVAEEECRVEWTETDFAPIAVALDALFAADGPAEQTLARVDRRRRAHAAASA
jgi:hypothetical protein